VRSVRPDASNSEIKRKIVGRIDALVAALDFLSVTSDRSDLHNLVVNVIGPLSPDATRMRPAGPFRFFAVGVHSFVCIATS
jgi:hypothetical protein